MLLKIIKLPRMDLKKKVQHIIDISIFFKDKKNLIYNNVTIAHYSIMILLKNSSMKCTIFYK